MLKRIGLCFFALLMMMVSISKAEMVDVQIKGMDDGVKSTKQQDYKEAVLFAKREAIERAGVEIKSKSVMKDFVLYQDYIESQSEAVLLPGYQIIDTGYSAEGIYQIVLIGKIEINDKSRKKSAAKDMIDFGGYQWKVLSEKWDIIDGSLSVIENNDSAIISLVPKGNMNNYTFETDVDIINDGGLSFHLRSNPLHGSTISVKDDNMCAIVFNLYPKHSIFNLFIRRPGITYGKGIWTWVEPTWRNYQKSTLFTGKSDRIKIQVRGSYFKIYINNILLTQFWEEFSSDGTISIVAFEKSKYKFSNFKLTS